MKSKVKSEWKQKSYPYLGISKNKVIYLVKGPEDAIIVHPGDFAGTFTIGSPHKNEDDIENLNFFKGELILSNED